MNGVGGEDERTVWGDVENDISGGLSTLSISCVAIRFSFYFALFKKSISVNFHSREKTYNNAKQIFHSFLFDRGFSYLYSPMDHVLTHFFV